MENVGKIEKEKILWEDVEYRLRDFKHFIKTVNGCCDDCADWKRRGYMVRHSYLTLYIKYWLYNEKLRETIPKLIWVPNRSSGVNPHYGNTSSHTSNLDKKFIQNAFGESSNNVIICGLPVVMNRFHNLLKIHNAIL